MTIEFSTPSFTPREYEGEHILYTLYGLDSDGDELDDIITSPKKSTVIHTIKELRPDYRRIYNGMHVTAILYDKNGRMLDSEVVWSTDQDESKGANEDAYMDALDAELDEIIAAGAASRQAAAADAKLLEEPAPEFTDAEYMDVMKAINRLGRARVRAISQKAGLPLTKTGRILKELVASGYAFGRKQGASNVFILTPEGEAEVPPPELNSKVPERVKKLILSPAYSSASVEDRVDFINKMYDEVEKAGIGDIHWNSAGSGDWLWASVKPSKRDYYLITITRDGTFGTATFNNPDKNAPVGETATRHGDWSIAEFQKYLDERIPAIQAAYAKVKDYESKYYYYSFYSSKENKNVKNKEEMLAVVEGTKDTGMTYYYRCGFAFRGAGKGKVSYEKFREYCNNSMVAIEVNYNTMEAEVNEFSENDMY